MKKIRTLIGLPVVINGRKIGRVVKCELSDDLTQFEGVWITAVFFGTRFIPSDHLGILGQVSIVADNPGKRRRCKTSSLFRRAVGTDGSRVGAITGAEIDELSFRVEALELSCGLWDDLLNGRKRIRTFTLNQATGDVIIDAASIRKEAQYP